MRIKIGVVAVLSLIVSGCAMSGVDHTSTRLQSGCTLRTSDQDWIDRAVAAWRIAKDDIADIGDIEGFQAIFFSADCVLTSSNALTGAGSGVTWESEPHGGTIRLPDGDEMPAMVTSFTSADENQAFFVMSTPSVWRAGGVDGGPLGLETLMVAVMLHEGSHVVQSPTYGLQVSDLQRRYSLPDSFGDDSLQKQFEHDEDFARSIARETELFFQAAAAVDDATAFRLAREARGLMRARADKWFTDKDEYWREGEDIWLTFEGSGQWVGYQWLISSQGAAVPSSSAMGGFARRSRWWSQNQGLGVVLALDRLGDSDWRRHAFGDGAQTILEMLDIALEE